MVEKDEIKEKRKSKEYVMHKLKNLAKKVLDQIYSLQDPVIEVPVRRLDNVSWDEKRDILVLGDREAKRNFADLKKCRKFTQTIMVLALALELLKNNVTQSLRDCYYALLSTIPELKEKTFKEQQESDAIIEDLEVILGLLREEMNIRADKRGYMAGPFRWVERYTRPDGTVVEVEKDGTKQGIGGAGVPEIVEPERFDIIEVKADFVLLIEKAAVFTRFMEDEFWKKFNCILITGQGQPPRSVRRLLHRFRYEFDLPVYVLSVARDELVWYIDEKGFLRVEKIEDYFNKLVKLSRVYYDGFAYRVPVEGHYSITSEGLKEIEYVVKHPLNEEMYEIILEDGFRVKVTKSHSVIVLDENLNLVEKKASEVKEGDYMLVNIRVPNIEKLQKINLAELIIDTEIPSKYKVKLIISNGNTLQEAILHKNFVNIAEYIVIGEASPIKNVIEDVESLARFLGYYVAEGCITGNGYRVRLTFGPNEDDYAQDVKNIVEKLFGVSATIRKAGSETVVDIDSRALAIILDELFNVGKNAKEKRVPWIIFNLPTKAKLEFLRGYLRGDGGLREKKGKDTYEIYAKTASKELAFGLVHLLLQLGIKPNLEYEESEGKWVVIIRGVGELKKVLDIAKDLNEDIARIIAEKEVKKIHVSYGIPVELIKDIREYMYRYCEDKEFAEKILYKSFYTTKKLHVDIVRKFLERIPEGISEKVDRLKKLLELGFLPYKVREVRKVEYKGDVYDLGMVKPDNFVVNLILVHNTDADPWGYYIYSVVKRGSINLAYLSERLATPDAKFIGFTTQDKFKYGFSDDVIIALNDRDRKRIQELMNYPWFKNEAWQKELRHMLQKGFKMELEAAASKGLRFITETYLPSKLKEQDFLP